MKLIALLLLAASACEGQSRPVQGSTAATRRGDVLSETTSASVAPTQLPVVAPITAPSAAPIASPAKSEVRMPTEWQADLAWNGKQRLAHAKEAKESVVKALFEKAGVSYPPHNVLYRVFKQESELEVWAGDKDKPLALIATYGVCAASGVLGPKRREGDRQVPEGYYQVGYFHPMSSYYLSAQVNYPNKSDKLRGGPSPGSDILIHGKCASIGCVSMTDERIEEIYLVGWGAFMKGRPTAIHIFPARDFDALYKNPEYAEHHAFWREIEPGKRSFDDKHTLPKVTIDSTGRYLIEP